MLSFSGEGVVQGSATLKSRVIFQRVGVKSSYILVLVTHALSQLAD